MPAAPSRPLPDDDNATVILTGDAFGQPTLYHPFRAGYVRKFIKAMAEQRAHALAHVRVEYSTDAEAQEEVARQARNQVASDEKELQAANVSEAFHTSRERFHYLIEILLNLHVARHIFFGEPLAWLTQAELEEAHKGRPIFQQRNPGNRIPPGALTIRMADGSSNVLIPPKGSLRDRRGQHAGRDSGLSGRVAGRKV